MGRTESSPVTCCTVLEWNRPSIRLTLVVRSRKLIRPNTRLVWCESPGSITMEVQDVPAIAAAAHEAGALLVIDNTWSAGVYFDALAHGADLTMQALTKYVGGHSDLLLGSVTTKDPGIYKQLGALTNSWAAPPRPMTAAWRYED